MIQSYEDLEIYKRSYQVALTVHNMTREFPDIEKYEMGSQLRIAAVSVSANIAEGYGKKASVAEFKRFLEISQGSSNEVKVYISMAYDLGYISKERQELLINEYTEIGKMINVMIKKWK